MVLPAVLIAGVAYVIILKPWSSRWGATDTELIESLPGDSLVTRPDFISTRAVTIHAPVAAVWPWLARIGGSNRPLEQGADFHIYPKMPALQVAAIVPGEALIVGAPGESRQSLSKGFPHVSWAFVLRPVDERTTRLIIRFRADYRADWSGSLLAEAMQPVNFVMERNTMLEIRRRAEQPAPAR